jgi:ActR/RegA family two-component response regulator
MTMSRAAPLRVLVVVEDEDVSRAIEHVVHDEGDLFVTAGSVEEAVQLAATARVDVAFVELRVEGGAALALCHHLPSLSPNARVQVILHPPELDRGPEALSLGASGVLVAPPTGEAIARVLNDIKAEHVRKREVTTLEAKLARERRRLETYDRLVRFARGAAPSDAVRAIVDGVSQLTTAQGVALYATFGDDDSERVLLASIGTALDFPSTCAPADLSRLVQARSARVVPLIAASGAIGMLVLDRAPASVEQDIAQLADLAAAMLSIVDRQDPIDESVRVFPPKHFRTVADRLLTLAQRHDRRCSVLAITIPGDKPNRREEATREIADIVRTTDALCGLEDGDLLLFLPETSGLGAQACRRRILARLHGDRRARPGGAHAPVGKGQAGSGTMRSGEPRSKGPPVSVGVATFPHDGTTLRRLVKAARARAADDARSPVHALSLDGLALNEVIDALLARPMLDAGPRSSYPLDIACSALFALAARACKEAQRGGGSNVTTTLQPGLGLAAAARQVGAAHVHDVRAEPGCDNIEAIVVEAEHNTWVCCGRIVGERFQGVHAADPLLADIIERRLSAVGAVNAG